MKDTGKLWIDLTMLLTWPGQLTGIQRVEYNLAVRFSENPNTRFCVFDKDNRRLIEYDFKHIAYKINQLQLHNQQHIIESVVDNANHYGRALRFIKKSSKIVVRVLPNRSKAYLHDKYHRWQIKQSPTSAQPKAQIKQSDTLLILSGDWSDGVFSSVVNELRSDVECKVLQVVYDMLPVVQPAFFVPYMSEQFSNYMESIFKISDGILAISESTKRDIELFQKAKKLPNCPIKVFRLGEDFVDMKHEKPQLPIEPGKFLLSVGTVEARKNHLALYYMVREAIRSNIDLPTIVVAGKQGWLVDNFLYLVKNDPVISQKIIFLHGGTDRELAWLFKNCLFTLYPSFYEGWGLPIAESLFYGKLCLASGTSSMPEIAGDLIDYYSPNNPGEMLECTAKYLNNPKRLKDKEEKIKEKYTSTSWDATFKQVEDYLLEL